MNKAHVDIVRLGKDAIDDWRRVNPGELLDLCGADLREANLRGANLYGADLRGADLIGANLIRTTVCDCNFDGARITYRGEIVRIRFKVESANFADYANGGGG